MDQFVEKDYQTKERQQTKYLGEPVAIRRIDIKDLIDMVRVRNIMDDPETQKFITDAKGSTDEANAKWAQAHSNRFFVYAVSASVDESDPNERSARILKAAGFIQISGAIQDDKDDLRLSHI